MRAWWNPRDELGVKGETMLTNEMSQDEIIKLMADQLEIDL